MSLLSKLTNISKVCAEALAPAIPTVLSYLFAVELITPLEPTQALALVVASVGGGVFASGLVVYDILKNRSHTQPAKQQVANLEKLKIEQELDEKTLQLENSELENASNGLQLITVNRQAHVKLNNKVYSRLEDLQAAVISIYQRAVNVQLKAQFQDDMTRVVTPATASVVHYAWRGITNFTGTAAIVFFPLVATNNLVIPLSLPVKIAGLAAAGCVGIFNATLMGINSYNKNNRLSSLVEQQNSLIDTVNANFCNLAKLDVLQHLLHDLQAEAVKFPGTVPAEVRDFKPERVITTCSPPTPTRVYSALQVPPQATFPPLTVREQVYPQTSPIPVPKPGSANTSPRQVKWALKPQAPTEKTPLLDQQKSQTAALRK